MPSPFPGMDPFIESQEWSDFHPRAISVIAELLAPHLGDRYVARIQRRVYVERDPPEEQRRQRRHIEPDVSINREPQAGGGAAVAIGAGAAAVKCYIPQPEKRREAYLVIRDLGRHGGARREDVVTVVELLSPTNKRVRGDGRRAYLRKRREVLDSDSHLVELDLLRGGRRMPFRTPIPVNADYVALVSRTSQRPVADLYPLSLRQRLPVIPIPLAAGDTDASLDLQAVLVMAYDRARYGHTLNYSAPLLPPADPDTRRWIDDLLASEGVARPSPEPSFPAAEPS